MRRLLGLWIALSGGLILASSAAAEGLLDVYGGGAFTRSDRVSLTGLLGPARDDMDFEDSSVVGARIGLWLEGVPVLGGALDLSAYNADGKDGFDPTDIDIVPIAALVMLRIPLLEEGDFPNGRLQPYAALGPSLVFSTLDVRPVFDDTQVDIGVDGRLGLVGLLAPRVGLFFEWRVHHFEPRYEGTGSRVETEITTHLLQAGLRLQF